MDEHLIQNNIEKVGEEFSLSENFNEWIRNPSWKDQYIQLSKGVYNDVPINQMPLNAAFWEMLSSSFDKIGWKFNEKIANIISNIHDIETCELKSIKSISDSFGVKSNESYYLLDYPESLDRLINVLTINKDKLISVSGLITESTLSGMLNNEYESDEEPYISMGMLTTRSITELINKYGMAVSGYYHISADNHAKLIEETLSSNIMYNINLGGLLDEVKNDYENGYPDQNSDTKKIQNLKLTLKVPQTFIAVKEADIVQSGKKLLSDYDAIEQQIIMAEINGRNDEERLYEGGPFARYGKESKRIIRDYVEFIESIYNNGNDGHQTSARWDGKYELTSNGTESESFFSTTSGGIPLSGTMIENAVHSLRNICIKTSYFREYLKRMGAKYATYGTRKAIQNSISELIAREFTAPSYWNYYSESSGLVNIGDIPIVNELSSASLGDIRIIEYADSTEYMNISASSDTNSVSSINPRYWEGNDLENAIASSDLTEKEVGKFYNDLGIEGFTSGNVQSLVNQVYDLGAVSATISATFDGIPTVTPSNGIGADGKKYELNQVGGIYVALVSSNFENIELWNDSPNLNGWIDSLLIQPIFSEFKEKWIGNPQLSAWVNDVFIFTSNETSSITVSSKSLELGNLDLVESWIRNNTDFQLTGLVENDATKNWMASPLISKWDMDTFRTEWQNHPDISFWVSLSTLESNYKDWANIPELKAWMLYKGYSIIPLIPSGEWYASEFVASWNSIPFSNSPTGYNLNYEEDWATSANPFVSAWYEGNPYEISSTTFSGTLPDVQNYLCSMDMIPPVDGGIFSNSLSGMYVKYLGNELSGSFPPANNKNTVHPTMAMLPFVWNLIKIASQNSLDNVYKYVSNDSIEIINEISSMIGEYGNVTNSWINDFIDATAYQTGFEISNNTDISGNVNSKIGRDDPYDPQALNILINRYDEVELDIGTLCEDIYGYLNFDAIQMDNVQTKLQAYAKEIIKLCKKKIYQYAVDDFDNVYVLFKDENTREAYGEIWMRIKDHPLPFPLCRKWDGGSTTPTGMKYVPRQCQVDFESNRIRYLELATTCCKEFGITNVGEGPMLWAYSENEETTYNKLFLFKIQSNGIGSFSASKLRGGLYSIDFDRTTRIFLNIYSHYADFVVASIDKFSENESLRYEEGRGYEADLKFWQYNLNNGFVAESTIPVTVNYNECQSGEGIKWGLSKTDSTVSIMFESESLLKAQNVSGYFETGLSGEITKVVSSSIITNKEFMEKYGIPGYEEYWPNYNVSGSEYDNGITCIDFSINETLPVGKDYSISYYEGALVDPGYVRMNGGIGHNLGGIYYGLQTDGSIIRPYDEKYFTSNYAFANPNPTIFDFDAFLDNKIMVQFFGTSGYPSIAYVDDLAYMYVNNDGNHFRINLVDKAELPPHSGTNISYNGWEFMPVDLFALSGTMEGIGMVELDSNLSAAYSISGYNYLFNYDGMNGLSHKISIIRTN